MKKLLVLPLAAALFSVSAMAGGDRHNVSGDDCVKKMKTKYANKAWLGVEYAKLDNGYYKISEVLPNSPAEQAGFQVGDVMLAMNGVKYTKDNKAALKTVWADVGPGTEVDYKVKRNGEKVALAATLDNVPSDIQTQWIAEHMKEAHPNHRLASTD